MKLNPIEKIESSILNRFSTAETALDSPENGNGSWFLDVDLNAYSLIIEWHPQKGFGITSNSEIEYGEGVDEVYDNLAEVEKRILGLLLSQTKTKSPTTLKEIREEMGITQRELGNSLNTSQVSIAKLEKMSNPKLSTLQKYASGLGGDLAILISFPNGKKEEICLKTLAKQRKRFTKSGSAVGRHNKKGCDQSL